MSSKSKDELISAGGFRLNTDMTEEAESQKEEIARLEGLKTPTPQDEERLRFLQGE